MTKFSILVVLATLYCSAAIAAVVSASQNTPASPAETPLGPDSSLPPRFESQIPTVSVAMTVPTPSGVPILSPGWNLARPKPDGLLAPPLVYAIPNTDKTISFTSINSPLPIATVLMCFLQASSDILNRTISMGRDGFIEDGKFAAHSINGTTNYVAINVQDQVTTGQKVTYGTLALVLRGLGQFMTAQNSFFEAAFNIYDASWGQVGFGSVVGSQFAP